MVAFRVRVRDTKVDADAIHQQNGFSPSVCVRKAWGAFVGQLAKLPHKSAPCLAYTYARTKAVLLMNRVGVHFCVAHPYAKRYHAGTNLVLRDPDIRKAFGSERAVNEASRLVLELRK